MSMRAVRALDLSRKIGDRHELLGPGRQVAQADLSGCQLVADDHGEMCSVARRCLELLAALRAPEPLAELSAAELRTRRDARRAEVRGDLQPCGGVVRVRSDDDSDECAFPRHLRAGLREREDEPVDADSEPDAGCRPAPEELHEAVVATAATDRLPLALSPG